MTATMDDLKKWVNKGIESPICHYCIVMHDTFDHDNYPVYAKDATECLELIKKLDGQNQQKVEEVYDLMHGDRDMWFVSNARIDERPR